MQSDLPENGQTSAESALGGRPLGNCFSILIVDDMKSNRMLLRQILRSVGYHTYEVASGEEALEFLQSRLPSLIVMDVEMPGISGIETTAQIRETGGELALVPIVAATGNPIPGVEQELYGVGADAFVPKPVDVAELLGVVSALIRSGRPEDPNQAAAARRSAGRQEVRVLGL